MTLHESKHPGYSDLGRLHQHFIGDATPVQPADAGQAAPPGGAPTPMPPLPAISLPVPPTGASINSLPSPSSSPQPPVPAPTNVTPPATPHNLPVTPAAPPVASGTGRTGGDPADRLQPRRAERAIYKHADLGRFRDDPAGPGSGSGSTAAEDCFDRLAALAEPESWSSPGSGTGTSTSTSDPTWVLREYVEWTFERLHGRRQVVTSPDGAHSAFNTGLVTVQQEPIHGVFVPNRNADGPPWQLQGWCTDGDRQLSDHFPEPPPAASYAESPADLVFDWRRQLSVGMKRLLESKENLSALPGPLRSNPYQAGLLLEGAVRRAEARARRDHRAAVPGWDPIAERVDLMLPLSLTTPGTADVALVVSREGDAYHGRAVLTLDAAYARARQLGPIGSWLQAR